MNFRFTKDGEVKEIPYQQLIRSLGMENEELHGAPLSSGGAPQAASLMLMLQDIMPDMKVGVFLNGNQIL